MIQHVTVIFSAHFTAENEFHHCLLIPPNQEEEIKQQKHVINVTEDFEELVDHILH